jgi:hypothetical protein
MPKVKRSAQRGRSRRRQARSPFRPIAAATPERKPVRGMKLKTVSRLTLLFALACLGAFVAGRPPVPAGAQASSTAGAAQSRTGHNSQRLALRNDDARRLPLRLRR